MGEALLASGRIDEAIPLAQQAVAMTRYIKARGVEAWALRLLAEITSRRDPPDDGEPEACFRQASAIAEQLGMRPLAAHCHFGLGRLARRAGKREEARAHLTSATASYRDLGMKTWLGRVEAELAALRVSP
jgi:tetratricopeptide (TPR) repeat protein